MKRFPLITITPTIKVQILRVMACWKTLWISHPPKKNSKIPITNWNRGCVPKIPKFHIWNSRSFRGYYRCRKTDCGAERCGYLTLKCMRSRCTPTGHASGCPMMLTDDTRLDQTSKLMTLLVMAWQKRSSTASTWWIVPSSWASHWSHSILYKPISLTIGHSSSQLQRTIIMQRTIIRGTTAFCQRILAIRLVKRKNLSAVFSQ
jgi:hypothetical protein